LRKVEFEPRDKHKMVIDPKAVDANFLGENIWENAGFDDQEDTETHDAIAEQAEQQVPFDKLRADSSLAAILTRSLLSVRNDNI